MAPRNGGVTKEAVTSARMVCRSGMSVRDTSQPIGAATTQQIDGRGGRDDGGGEQRIEEIRIGEQRDEILQREVPALSVKL